MRARRYVNTQDPNGDPSDEESSEEEAIVTPRRKVRRVHQAPSPYGLPPRRTASGGSSRGLAPLRELLASASDNDNE